jgi:hypothetical protein
MTLPVRSTRRDVTAEIIPIKDRGENVRLVLIFLE